MAELATIKHRAVIATQALATMGMDPEWDRKLAAYVRAECLQFADSEFGANFEASEAYARERIRLKHVYGAAVKTNPRAKEASAVAFAAHKAAENAWYENFTKPYWASARELVKTPAPTLAAALFKVHVVYADEVWNDSGFELDAMRIVSEDMARLAGSDTRAPQTS